MVYLGYDFDFGKINDIPNEEPTSVRESLSVKQIKLAKNFLESVRDFIAIEVSLFEKHSKLSKNAVGISIMENFTGKLGYPATEEKQAFHMDYPPGPGK